MLDMTEELKQQLPGFKFTRWDDFGAYDALLVLNACPVQCAHIPNLQDDVPKAILSSQSLNYQDYPSYQELLQATGEYLCELTRHRKRDRA